MVLLINIKVTITADAKQIKNSLILSNPSSLISNNKLFSTHFLWMDFVNGNLKAALIFSCYLPDQSFCTADPSWLS